MTARPFIYHLRPRILSRGADVKLIDLQIYGLGIHLKADDLATGRPYPNKAWHVGRRKIGRKAVDGLLLNLKEWPPDIEMEAQWAINAEYVATHRVIYTLLDEDFGAASDDMTLWHAAGGQIGGPPIFQNRVPNWAKNIAPIDAQPRMEVFPRFSWDGDQLDGKGRVRERTEVFALPTIEPERFLGPDYPRERIATPKIEMAL